METLANEEKRHLETIRRMHESEIKLALKKAAFVDEMMTTRALFGYFGVPCEAIVHLEKHEYSHVDHFVDRFGPVVGKLFFS